MRIYITTNADSIQLTSNDPPSKHDVLNQWLEGTLHDVDSRSKPLHPAVQQFQNLIENDATLYMQANCMFAELPGHTNDEWPPRHARIRDYHHILQVMNHVMTTAPTWDPSLDRVGLVGFPLNVVLNYPMSTPSGRALFLNENVNAALRRILNCWAEYLSSAASTDVLSTKDGWLSPQALKAMQNQSSSALSFEETFICDPSAPYYGFLSWDDFFTRRLRSEARSISSSSDPGIINPCESSPLRLSTNVAHRSRFWLKSQPYSLIDMLTHDSLAERFVGGTVYQAYLSALSYHRWHSPVSGRVVKAYRKAGTYYSAAPFQGHELRDNFLDDCQPYLAEVATRAMIFIEADDPDVGMVCFIPIGLAECSTCEILVVEGQYVRKGEELGMFHFGGSSFCLLFGPGVELEWVAEVAVVEDGVRGAKGKDGNVLVNSRLATVK